MTDRAARGAGFGRSGLAVAWVFGLTLGGAALAQDKADEPEQAAEEKVLWEDEPYIIEDGKVDFGTYNGYRRYHSHCHTCHGPDGLGSSYAPALTDSIEDIGYEGFIQAVVFGIENVGAAQQSVMPSFSEDANVTENIDDIWAYLKGRADGVVPRGRPARLDPEEDPVWKERKG